MSESDINSNENLGPSNTIKGKGAQEQIEIESLKSPEKLQVDQKDKRRNLPHEVSSTQQSSQVQKSPHTAQQSHSEPLVASIDQNIGNTNTEGNRSAKPTNTKQRAVEPPPTSNPTRRTLSSVDPDLKQSDGNPKELGANESNHRSTLSSSKHSKTNSGSLLPDQNQDYDESLPLIQSSSRENPEFEAQSVGLPPSSYISVLLAIKKLYDYINLKNPKLIHLLIVFLILLVVFIFFTIRHFDELISQFAEVNIESISILGINVDGIDGHVVGSLYINYDNVKHMFYRYALKIGSLVVASVTFIPNGRTIIYAKPAGSTTVPLPILDTFPPEMSVDVLNKRITDIEITSKTEIHEYEIVKLWKDLSEIEGDTILIDIQVALNTMIKSKFFSLSSREINFWETIELERAKFVPNIQVRKSNISSTKDSICFHADVYLLQEVPIVYSFGSLNWDVILKDCHLNDVPIGTWASLPFNVDPGEPASFSISGSIKSIPDLLLSKCSGTGMSVVNEIAQQLLNEDYLTVTILLCAEKGKNPDIPPWLGYILRNLRYDFKVESQIVPTKLKSFEIESIGIHVPNDDYDSPILAYYQDSNFTLYLNYKSKLDFQVDRLKHEIELSSKGKSLLSGKSLAYDSIYFNFTSATLILEVVWNNMDFELFEPSILGQLVNDWIHANISDSVIAALKVSDIQLELPVGTVNLKELDLGSFDIASFFTLPKQSIIPKISIYVKEIYYILSNLSYIQFMVNIEVENLTNIIFEVAHETLRAEVFHSKMHFGEIIIDPNLQLDEYSTTLTLAIFRDTKDESHSSDLDTLLSDYISDIPLYVNIPELGASKHVAMDLFLNEIHLEKIKVPALDDIVKTGVTEDSNGGVFLVKAIVHIVTSEIQLTLFNPVADAELFLDLILGGASYEGHQLGSIKNTEHIIIPPGVNEIPSIPITISGIGLDILKKAMNGNLAVDVVAKFKLRIDKFQTLLQHKGHDVKLLIQF